MGVSAATWFHAYRLLRQLGLNNLANFQVWPVYRQHRSEQGWPWWLEYLCWLMLVTAVILLSRGALLLNQLESEHVAQRFLAVLDLTPATT